MTRILLDTHVWAWSLTAEHRLSSAAIAAMASAEAVYVSAISFYEIGQKARLGRWPEIASQVPALPDIARRQGLQIVDVSPDISLSAALLPWAHRDPFDRIILSTARARDLTLISADSAFGELDLLFGQSDAIW
ncbi:type II toxin-antitoxin system VapC family toxin [Devosia sp.]|uniref:type II toxin-antitoxin system VapC family toxin n=1 Tax=Devosia sp. TaxID=1871048 RepID=UPI002AFEF3CB|nr:type II toxin-antitoxin system VapC family toxin [Devosia sp.]